MVRELAGTMFIKDLAKIVGTSDSNLDRWAKRNGVNVNALKYKDDVIHAVCRHYEANGIKSTIEAFPGIKIRSIVERYKLFKPRQLRWSAHELTEAVKMAGLVSLKAQAKYFNRPNAFEGSIKSLWTKRFGMGEGSVNGMVHWHAKHLVGHKARYLNPMGLSRKGELTEFRRIILWVDMEKCLKDETPKFMKDAIYAMANFQRWIWRSKDPKPLIVKMIMEREIK